MVWYTIQEKKPKYNQKVIVADIFGEVRAMTYKGKMKGATNNYKFTKISRPEIYRAYLDSQFHWAELDCLPMFIKNKTKIKKGDNLNA